MDKRLLVSLFLFLFFCSPEERVQKTEPTSPEYLSPRFCDEDNLQFIQKETIGDKSLLLYYIYNIPNKKLILKRMKFAQFFPLQDTQGCSSKYIVYCKCNGTDCGGISDFIIKDAVTSPNKVYVYSDFNCYAEDIKTGRVIPLLDKLRDDVANDPLVRWVGFEKYIGSTFQPPAVYENQVVFSYLIGDLPPFYEPYSSYLLLVNIDNPEDYKLIPANFYFAPAPAMDEKYIVWGMEYGLKVFEFYIYNIQSEQSKRVLINPYPFQQGLKLLTIPIHYTRNIEQMPYSLNNNNLIFITIKSEEDLWYVYDVILYNIEIGNTKIIHSNHFDSTSAHPTIWGDKVVWLQSKRKEKSESGSNLAQTSIMLYNLTTGELREIVPEKPNPLWPTTNGRYIAWLDTEVGDEEKGKSPDVYLYDIETGETWEVTQGLE